MAVHADSGGRACKDLLKRQDDEHPRSFYMTKHTIKGYKENTFDEQTRAIIIEDLEVGPSPPRELHLFTTRRGAWWGHGDSRHRRRDRSVARGSGGWAPSITRTTPSSSRTKPSSCCSSSKEAVWHRLQRTSSGKTGPFSRAAAGRHAAHVGSFSAHTESSCRSTCSSTTIPGVSTSTASSQGSISLAYESIRSVPRRVTRASTRDFKAFKLSDK